MAARTPSPNGGGDPFSSRAATPLEAPHPPFATSSGAADASSRPTSTALTDADLGAAPLAPPAAPFRDGPSPSASASDLNRDSAYNPAAYPPGTPGPNGTYPLLSHSDSAQFTPFKDDPSSPALGGAAAAAPAGYAAPAARYGSSDEGLSEKPRAGGLVARAKRRPLVVGLLALGALAIVVIAVIVPVYFTVIKKDKSSGGTKSSSSSGTSSQNPGSPTGATTGGDGSVVIMEDGTSFVYNNSFGGFWVQDPANPFNNSARPNSWTKPLSEKWDFVNDRING
jgi:glucan 1,3-beta-glucosidase